MKTLSLSLVMFTIPKQIIHVLIRWQLLLLLSFRLVNLIPVANLSSFLFLVYVVVVEQLSSNLVSSSLCFVVVVVVKRKEMAMMMIVVDDDLFF